MATLQVRELPEDLYAKLNYLSEKDHRSLTQETVVLLRESIEKRLGDPEKRKKALYALVALGIEGNELPDPVKLVREDRER